MRSRELLLAALLSLLLPPAVAAAAPQREEIQRAAEAVRRHPDLGGSHKEKKLHLRQRDEAPRERSEASSYRWLADLVRWIAESARVLMWLAGALLIALLLVGAHRWIRVRGRLPTLPSAPLPSHVRDLDIRPESLPDAVGASAARLWERGEHRAALSLLYRGALSRLVHVHAVPVRSASTEGECLSLAASRLDAQRSAFFARLVAAWQLAVYGARLPDPQQALALCRDFDLQLPAPAGRASA